MLFLAVVNDFDFFAKMKIQFKRGMVHCEAKLSILNERRNRRSPAYEYLNVLLKLSPISRKNLGDLQTSSTFLIFSLLGFIMSCMRNEKLYFMNCCIFVAHVTCPKTVT